MERERLWSKVFIQIFAIETMLQFGLYMMRPLISGYAVSLGASLTLAGFLAGLLPIASLATRPFSGIITDHLKKKTLLTIACVLFTASAFGCALSDSILVSALFLALQGFAFAFKSTLVVSIASLVVPKTKIGSAVGWLGLAYTVACALGPAAGSLVGRYFRYEGDFIISGVLLLGGLVLTLLFKSIPGDDEKNKEVASSYGKHAQDGAETRLGGVKKKITACFYTSKLSLTVVAGMLMIAQGVTSSFIVLVGDMRGLESASLYFLFYSLATLAARPLAGRASDTWGAKRVVIPMMVTAALGMAVLAGLESFLGIILSGILMGIGQGSAYCALQAEAVRSVPEDYVGRATNTFYLGPDICMGLGPVIGGLIMQVLGIATMFIFCAVSIVLGLGIFIVSAPSSRREAVGANDEE